jgi:cytochrome c oxidase subunit 1
MIGRQFLFMGLAFLLIGGGLALMVRYHLAWPDDPIPMTSWIPGSQDGYMGPEFYNASFTMHATIMIFFVVMPILVGGFGNFLIPLMIGTRDMAFPLLNMLSFWIAAVAGVLMISGFFVEGGHAAAGWTSYAPLSSVPEYTGVYLGQDLWCISILVLGVSSLMADQPHHDDHQYARPA